MQSISMLVTKRLLNPGVLDVLLPVFLVSEAVVLTVQVKQRSVTCAEVDACLLPPKPGEDGIDPSTKSNDDMPSALRWQPVPSPLS